MTIMCFYAVFTLIMTNKNLFLLRTNQESTIYMDSRGIEKRVLKSVEHCLKGVKGKVFFFCFDPIPSLYLFLVQMININWASFAIYSLFVCRSFLATILSIGLV